MDLGYALFIVFICAQVFAVAAVRQMSGLPYENQQIAIAAERERQTNAAL